MLMSHKHQFIFIHIYKTAGTSVTEQFAPHARLLDRLAYQYWLSNYVYGLIINKMNWHDGGLKQFTGYHKHAKAFEVRQKLGSRRFEKYFKFAFVRNPYDFLVSLYFYLRQAKEHNLHKKVSAMEFREFSHWFVGTRPACQVDFLLDEQREDCLVNFIGRYENLQSDVQHIVAKLDLGVGEKLAHKNQSVQRTSRDFRDYYDPSTLRLVYDHYQRDFELLGYSEQGHEAFVPLLS